MKVSVSRLMFGPLLLIRYFINFLKLLDNLRKVLLTEISDSITWHFLFLWPYFGLETQRGNQPLSWSFQFSFWLWRCDFILSRLSNFDEMSKVTYLSLPLISLCYLTFRRSQLFMFTARKCFSLPVNFSSQKVFQLEEPW